MTSRWPRQRKIPEWAEQLQALANRPACRAATASGAAAVTR
jgi:hypothetical protein